MDYILDEMNELGADGVDFVPISEQLAQSNFTFCMPIESYNKEEWIKGVGAYPKSGRLYWKMVDGKKVYCNK